MNPLLPWLRLMRFDRPIGTLLLLWPTLWALWIAGGGRPDPDIVLVFIAGTFVMRSAGCVINDYADRHFDPLVERTRDRPLATGELTPRQALGLFAALLVIALLLVLQLNLLTIGLAFIGAAIAALYPFTKRFTHLPQFILGVAFAWGIPMAFAALTGRLPLDAWLLLAANLCWVVAYDTQYAMVDRPDDLGAGIKSTAILFGRHDLLLVGLFHAAALLLLAFTGWRNGLSWHYYLGLLAAGGTALWQRYLCGERERQRCFRAFLNNSWFGAFVFTGIVLAYL